MQHHPRYAAASLAITLALLASPAQAQNLSSSGANPLGQVSKEEQRQQQAKESAQINQLNGIAALASFSNSDKSKLLSQLEGLTNEERLALLNQSRVFQRLSDAQKEQAIATLAEIVPPPVSNLPPVPKITATQESGPFYSFTFNGTQSSDPDGTIAQYQWVLSDGTTSSASSFTHRFPNPGYVVATFGADLTVTDDKGATATTSWEFTYDNTDTIAPVISRLMWGNPETLHIYATDNRLVERFEVSYDLQPFTHPEWSGYISGDGWRYVTIPWGSATETIAVRAYDGAGNVSNVMEIAPYVIQ